MSVYPAVAIELVELDFMNKYSLEINAISSQYI